MSLHLHDEDVQQCRRHALPALALGFGDETADALGDQGLNTESLSEEPYQPMQYTDESDEDRF